MRTRLARAAHLVLSATPSVPVLVYHSVGRDNGHPLWRHLTLPVETFEAQLAWLRREGYETVDLYTLHAHLAQGAPLPKRPIVLTFDDGFLDNWVFAAPLLLHYGFTATLFLCPAFVQAEAGLRPQVTDAASMREASRQTENWWGYVRWDEARALVRSGAFDIQAHGLTHHRHFTGPRVVDYVRPGSAHYWMRWNAAPDRQPYWLREPSVSEDGYGAPVYEHRESLLAPRYFPDEALAAHVREIVHHADSTFFNRPRWKRELDEAVRAFRQEHGDTGHVETHEAYRARVLHELSTCRRLLQEALDTRIDFLCWPMNQYNDEVHALALEAGFTATTCLERPNAGGADATRIGRTYFGQSVRSMALGKPWIVNLKFRGLLQLLAGRRRGYVKIFLANRLLDWYTRFPPRASAGVSPDG